MKENWKKLISYILGSIIISIMTIFLFPKVWHLFWPFVIGWVLSMIANPIVRFLENRLKLKRKHGSIVIIIVVLLFITLILYGLIAAGISLVQNMILELPDIFAYIEEVFQSLVEVIERLTADKGLVEIETVKDFIIGKLQEIVNMVSKKGIDYASAFLSNMPSFLMGAIFALISSFFFIKDKYKIDSSLKKWMRKWNLQKVLLIKESCIHVFKHYMEAQFKISAIIYIVLFAGLFILRIPYAPLIALGIAIVDLLPIFGTGTVLWPWIFIDLLLGKYKTSIGLLSIYIVSLVLRQIIQPKILSDSMGLSPLASLVLMYIGYQIGGFFGLLLAVPLGMIVYELYQKGLFNGFFDLLLKIKQKNNVQ